MLSDEPSTPPAQLSTVAKPVEDEPRREDENKTDAGQGVSVGEEANIALEDSRGSLSRLPVELLGSVLEYVPHEDLASCCLVSRSFLQPARLQLYGSIGFEYWKVNEFDKYVVDQKLRGVVLASPHLAKLVRTLVVNVPMWGQVLMQDEDEGWYVVVDGSWLESEVPDANWAEEHGLDVQEDIALLVASLPRLAMLCLQDQIGTNWRPDFLLSLASHTITYLRLSATLVPAIQAFPNLRALEYSEAPTLHDLYSQADLPALEYWSFGSFGNVEERVSPEVAGAFDCLAAASHHSLTSLHLELNRSFAPSLHQFTALRELNVTAYHRYARALPSYTPVFVLLSTLPPSLTFLRCSHVHATPHLLSSFEQSYLSRLPSSLATLAVKCNLFPPSFFLELLQQAGSHSPSLQELRLSRQTRAVGIELPSEEYGWSDDAWEEVQQACEARDISFKDNLW
ncbi:hypothetical protein JCM10213_005817 [Rhodosporidiobolus nylandii]